MSDDLQTGHYFHKYYLDQAMMLEADIILRGQGTNEQQMIPIVASPPAVSSDLTFDDWIKTVRNGKKGFELHFHSTEAIELTLQSLEGLEHVSTVIIHVKHSVTTE